MNITAATGRRGQPECLASMKRRAWAKSRDSLWQESEQEHCDPEDPQQSAADEDAQAASDEPGRVPNKITSWLIECRTPLGASLDDQSAPPSRGAQRNGCSFEDDLSLGAEANHLHNTNNKTESCFGLVAEQKRSQFKERGRSMNSTGSGKSSTVSSVSEVAARSHEHPGQILLTPCVSELLDLYEEDPEEILLNLGFGREEPDLASKVPSRFFNGSSSARGIDIKVYLGAQMQRMEVENPNYALTSRFRQIEVLTTVANEFFNLYSQVSGQPRQQISTRDQDGKEDEEAAAESSPPLKRNNSARNMAKLLLRKISKNNLTAASVSSESPDAHVAKQHSGHGPEPAQTDACTGQEQESSEDPDHQAETTGPKHSRRKDGRSLATVTEETNGDGEADRPTGDSPEQSSARQTPSGQQSTNQTDVERNQVLKDVTPAVEKPPPALAPPQLAQLRNENADSFDIEEIQSNDDEVPPTGTSRASDLSRTVSQQSDSSGFAEETSADSSSNLKVQVSSDSCDSETTVTSHPSQDVTTPVPMDQPVFDLPDAAVADLKSGSTQDTGHDGKSGSTQDNGHDGKSGSTQDNGHDGSSEEVPQYTAHQLPKRPGEAEQPLLESEDRTVPPPEPEPSVSASEQKLQRDQNQSESAPPTEEVGADAEAPEPILNGSGSLCPTPSPSPVLDALNRAKELQMIRAGHAGSPQPDEALKNPERGRGRRRAPMRRSSSLPTSLLSPSRVVSSVRIQLGRGQASCTMPRYSFKYTQETEGGSEEEAKDEKEEQEGDGEGETNCQSTLFINPASSSVFRQNPPRLHTEAPAPPKPIPRYLLDSQSSTLPPDLTPGGRGHWSTQSVPDLSSNQRQPGDFQQNIPSRQNQQSWNPGQVSSPHPNPQPAAQYVSPDPSPGFNSNPYPFPTLNPPLQYPSRLQPYGSLPNLHHHHSASRNHHSSLTSLLQPAAPTVPHHGSPTTLHQPPGPTTPHYVNSASPHPGSPLIHHQGYSYPYSHQLPYHVSPYAPSYLGYHGYSMYPHPAYPQPVAHCPPLVPEHGLHPALTPPAPGFFPGLGQALGLQPGLAPPAPPGPGSNQGPSSTEMQLRKVLHDIRGTVHSLSQNRADTPDGFSERRRSSSQCLVEFQQKRRSLNYFRNQMMDLELSIIRQQAVVYKHLSPADRLEVEQLHSLRSAVREELQELEQQLEDRLMELTHHGGLHRDNSVDSLSTASALRAMEPMSELLREQLYLQSELSYDGQALSTGASSRSTSPVRGDGGDDEQRRSVYRASINITPTLPPRPITNTVEEEDEGERDTGGGGGAGGGGRRELPEETGAAEGLGLQQLIKEIRQSVAREVRQEIYSELLAAVSPRHSPLPGRQQPL
ncbi:protein ITPRID2 isoform X2 [Betta splendens]|uniref:Protein ITPRID2 isoform X2 n=1 Tax=Betta splendens TaxID=158456 RepID=A0A9W2XHV7_BETSP|nr:protein ITPRID2 isoform X2 [Betta splendens]